MSFINFLSKLTIETKEKLDDKGIQNNFRHVTSSFFNSIFFWREEAANGEAEILTRRP